MFLWFPMISYGFLRFPYLGHHPAWSEHGKSAQQRSSPRLRRNHGTSVAAACRGLFHATWRNGRWDGTGKKGREHWRNSWGFCGISHDFVGFRVISWDFQWDFLSGMYLVGVTMRFTTGFTMGFRWIWWSLMGFDGICPEIWWLGIYPPEIIF